MPSSFNSKALFRLLGGGQDAISRMMDHAGIGLYVNGADGNLYFVNRPLAEILGFPDRDAFLASGMRASDFYVDTNDLQTFRDQVEADGSVQSFTFQARTIDGRLIWLSEHGTAVPGENGQIDYYVGSLVDVTAFVDTQNKLENAERNYRRFLDYAKEGIYRSSLDGKQLMANPALVKLNGYDSEEEQLNSVKDIAREWYVDPNRRKEFQTVLSERGFVEDFESEIYAHKSRERIWISENAYIVRDDDGTPLYYEGTVRDITQKKKAERALREALQNAERADHAKARFLAHMSHELRTPLNAVLGFSDIIRNSIAQNPNLEKIEEYANDIYESGRHLLDLINDVLDLSRVESNAMPVDLEPVDANRVLEATLGFIDPMARDRNISVVLEESACPLVRADHRRLQQCLLNILSNAIKFSHPGSSITASVSEQTSGIAIVVRDQGIGIPRHMIEEIGKPFVTVDDPTITASKGTGLGLTITRSLIELMEGEITIDSEEGKGTTVTLTMRPADR